MAKRPTKAIAPAKPLAPPAPIERQMGTELVQVEAVYHVKEIAPKTKGPWNSEAEKVAWTDPRTGYGCIIRRSARGGHLAGYVGVGPDHPLFGFEPAACRGFGLRAHGGINYGKECERYEQERIAREAVSVCHVQVSPPVYSTTKESRTVLEVKPHDDLWWIGFECNLPTDVIPVPPRNAPPTEPVAGVSERVYRDEAYVFDQCVWLAEQLRAIEMGQDLSSVQERWIPPLGFDPAKGSR